MAVSRGPEVLHLRGTVLPDAEVRDVYVVDGRITSSQPADARTIMDGGYLVPGLVDVHAHLSMRSPAGDDPPAEERVRASARAQLEAGVLAIREPGSPEPEASRHALGQDLPRTVTAGAFLCAPGGYLPGLGREVTADALPEAAAEEGTLSGAWVKVIVDFFGPDGRMRPCFPLDALAEAARRAHSVGARITGHAMCAEAIEQAVDAGFDSIEHATELRPDQLSEIAGRGIALVPTLVIGEAILAWASDTGADPGLIEDMRRMFDGQPAMVADAVSRGVTVLAGTDAGILPHGMVAAEVAMLLAAGVPPEVALGAASWTARDWLGLPGIEEGAPADLVGYPDDPREDVEALKRPRCIVLDGRRVP